MCPRLPATGHPGTPHPGVGPFSLNPRNRLPRRKEVKLVPRTRLSLRTVSPCKHLSSGGGFPSEVNSNIRGTSRLPLFPPARPAPSGPVHDQLPRMPLPFSQIPAQLAPPIAGNLLECHLHREPVSNPFSVHSADFQATPHTLPPSPLPGPLLCFVFLRGGTQCRVAKPTFSSLILSAARRPPCHRGCGRAAAWRRRHRTQAPGGRTDL